MIQGGETNPSNGCETQTKNELHCCLSTGELPEYIAGRERNMLQAGEDCCFTKINPIGNRSACPEVSVSSHCITVCLPPSSNPPSSWAVAISFSLLSQHRIFKKASKEASEHSQCMACHFLSVRLSGWMSPFSYERRMARTVPSLAPPLLPQIVRCGAVLLPQLVAAMVGASESDESTACLVGDAVGPEIQGRSSNIGSNYDARLG